MKHTVDAQFFPGWTRKSITFSIDDGHLETDAIFLSIVRPAGIRGTFNLCSHTMRGMTPEEYRDFYRGYEIANHSQYHPLALEDGVEYQISEEPFDAASADPAYLYRTGVEGLYHARLPSGWRRRAESEAYCGFIRACHAYLEEVFGEGSVRCFVWPHLRQKNRVVDDYANHFPGYYGVRESGMWGEDDGFPMPKDRRPWRSTTRDTKLLASAAKYAAQPDDGELKFFCFGVHSVDYDRNGKWDDLRAFAAEFGNNPAYYSAPVGELFDYEDAVKGLEITEGGVYNPSEVDLYIRVDGENVILKAGEKLEF